MNLKYIISFIICRKHGFPFKIQKVYPFYEFMYSNSTKYCVNLWEGIEWNIGVARPMLIKNGIVAWYKNVSAYYRGGSRMSDWAFGDDGKYRDFIFSHIEQEKP